VGGTAVQGAPLGGLGGRGEDRSYGVDGEQRLVELGYGGGVVPVGIGRGEGGCELHKVTAELARGSARAEELRSGRSTTGLGSPVFCRAAALFWGVGVGSKRKSRRNGILGYL